jgi:hypothetical protein
MTSEREKQQLDAVFHDILRVGRRVIHKEDYYAQLQTIWNQKGDPLPLSRLQKHVHLLRRTGLIKRKYYQTSVLGTLFITNELPIYSYVTFFQDSLLSIFNRSLTTRLPLDQFSTLYIESSKWYIKTTMKQGFSGYRLQEFQQVLNVAFEWIEIPTHLEDHARHIINEFLKQQYREDQSGRIIKFHPTTKPVSALTKRAPPPVKSKQGEWGRVLHKVLTDIYFWMVTCLSNKDHFLYDEPFFDIQTYAEKHRSIKVPNYTRAVSWV